MTLDQSNSTRVELPVLRKCLRQIHNLPFFMPAKKPADSMKADVDSCSSEARKTDMKI
jgi:hypothetical protein